MPPNKPASGAFRAAPPSSEATEVQDAVSRMFLMQDPDEISSLLCMATLKYTKARQVAIFLRNADGIATGDTPELLPEKAVIDCVIEEAKPITVSHGPRWITVFALRVAQEPVGILVVDVTGMAEEIVRMNLEPVVALAGQAAVMIHNARRITRSIGESTLLSNILDSIPSAIVTLDNDLKITRLNRNAMAMFEISSDAIGRPYREALLPVAAEVDGLLRDTEHRGYAMEKMATFTPAQGLELPIAASMSILRDDAFAPIGTILVFRDMTASRELERLHKLDLMKSEFVANVSHELKTPLASIKAYTEALLEMAGDGQMKSFLKVIDDESDRLLYLVNDLLNVSQIQSGRMKMNVKLVAARAIVDEISGISRVHSEKHKLVLEIADNLPDLLLDKEKMKEVLINLISNAIKYSPKGGEVRVRMLLEEANLRIEVQDEGIGIAKEDQARLFEPFYRVDPTASIPGTGLGLAISKAIVERHDGKVWFKSEAGKGTTFFLLIPVRRGVQ